MEPNKKAQKTQHIAIWLLPKLRWVCNFEPSMLLIIAEMIQPWNVSDWPYPSLPSNCDAHSDFGHFKLSFWQILYFDTIRVYVYVIVCVYMYIYICINILYDKYYVGSTQIQLITSVAWDFQLHAWAQLPSNPTWQWTHTHRNLRLGLPENSWSNTVSLELSILKFYSLELSFSGHLSHDSFLFDIASLRMWSDGFFPLRLTALGL